MLKLTGPSGCGFRIVLAGVHLNSRAIFGMGFLEEAISANSGVARATSNGIGRLVLRGGNSLRASVCDRPHTL
jgi:hypothetical protein